MKRWYVPLLTFLTLVVIASLGFVIQGSRVTQAASPASLAFIYHSDWWTATQFSADNARYRTVAGDFNGDGLDDIAILFRRTSPIPANVIYWMLGDGDNFDWQGINSSWSEDANHTGTVAAGDFDNDGYDDVATFTESGSVLYWFSDGSDFPQHWIMPVLPASPGGNYRDQVAGRVVAGDFDGDGLGDDIAALWDHSGIGRLQVFLSTGSAFHYRTWWSSTGTDFDVSRVSYRLVAGDFNKDGRDDVAAVYDEGSNGARAPVWLSSSFDPTGVSYGSFSYHPSWWSDTTYDAGSVTGRVAAGDFDGDGDDDISLLHEDPADANHIRAHILLSTRQDFAFQGEDPGWWDHYSFIPSYATGRVVVGDWDGDGVDDDGIIYGNSSYAQAKVLEATAAPPGPAMIRRVDKHDPACSDGAGVPYCTVQAAVDVANDGDTIMVAAGTYSEHVILPRYGVDGFNQSLTIQGAGPANTIVDGNASGTVFAIHRGGQITLSGLAIRNGNTDGDGGGVYNGGDVLVVANSALSGNSAGERGGAIYSAGFSELTVSNSALSGNSAGTGGGIYTDATVAINGSTVSGNTAVFDGGGLWTDAGLSVSNSTFSGNSAGDQGGGLYTEESNAVAINSSTFYTNSASYSGGGIYTAVGAMTVLTNTIVANNGGDDCAGPGGWDAMGSPNLDSDGTCPGFSITDNPLLGPLQDNGGPTPTHALLDGSPAIDAGSNVDCPATDQRGLPRPQDGDDDGAAQCDIGAFEVGWWTAYLPLVQRR